MTIHNQYGNRYLFYYALLALMAMVFFTISLSAREFSGAQNRTIKFELRLASHEPVKGWESVSSDVPSVPIWISPEAALTNADVAQAEPSRTNDDKSCVNLLLTEEGALKLARLTKAHIGEFLAIMIDGRVIRVPRIAAEITGGRARVDGNFTEEEASAIAEGITAQ